MDPQATSSTGQDQYGFAEMHRLRLGVVFLGRERPGFDPDWGSEVESAARKALDEMEYDIIYPDRKAVDDPSLRAAVEQMRSGGAEALLALQPTMADGRLAPVLGQQWDGPVVLWATPERQDSDRVSACSLVGQHTFAANLAHLGMPFEIAYGDPREAETRQRLREAVRLAWTASKLPKAKVGLIGYHAPGFIDMHADPAGLSRSLGAQLYHYGVQEFISAVQEVDTERIGADVQEVLEMNLPMEGVTEDDLRLASSYYLVLKELLSGQNFDALALRCWPELPNVLGQWPYLAVSRLVSEGHALSIEGDVGGALTRLLGNLLGLGPVHLSDWLEHDRHVINLWHVGVVPLQMCHPAGSEHGPRLGRHFNNDRPVVVNATLPLGHDVTVYRMWRCGDRYRLAGFEGETVEPTRTLLGTNCWTKVETRDVHHLFEELVHAGMPHHVAVIRGHHLDLLRRCARQVNVEWVRCAE